MPFLSDKSIRQRLNSSTGETNERINVEPAPADLQLGPCSIDLTLSTQFARFRRLPSLLRLKTFDPRRGTPEEQEIQDRWYKYYTVTESKGFVIRPNEVVLAMSRESLRLPKSMLGLITGRSSYSRMGIEVHLTQDLRQPGHSGQVLLQIKNNAPFSFRLYPGMRIAQLLIAWLDDECQVGYDESSQSKYKGEKGGISAKWFRDPDLKNRQIISWLTYLIPFLDVLLIVSALFSITVAVQSGARGALATPLFWTFIGVTALTAVVRAVIYVRR